MGWIFCRITSRTVENADDKYSHKFKSSLNPDFLAAIRYVFSVNILCGDALTLKDSSGSPIVFPEWSLVSGSKVKRRDFTFASLLDKAESQPTFDMVEDLDVDKNDPNRIVPTPVREYPMMNYLKVAQNE